MERMHGVVRLNTFDPSALAAAGERLREFDRSHAAQPGHLGHLLIDLGEGRRIAVNLWRSREDGDAALTALGPEVQRLLEPLMTAPSALLGAGPVLAMTLRTALDPGGR